MLVASPAFQNNLARFDLIKENFQEWLHHSNVLVPNIQLSQYYSDKVLLM